MMPRLIQGVFATAVSAAPVLVKAQDDGFWLGQAAQAAARTQAESNERIVFMVIVAGVIAAAIIAAALFFRRRDPPRKP